MQCPTNFDSFTSSANLSPKDNMLFRSILIPSHAVIKIFVSTLLDRG